MPFGLSRKDAAALALAISLVLSAAAAFAVTGSDAVKRGEYLFRAADCTSCHTDSAHKGAFLAGGPALKTPFGVFYAPNITPDPRFGIGAWSETDFRRALRQGIGRRGQYLYPVFPYPSFTHMTDRDIADLYAYLRTVKPVAKPSRQSKIKPPFNWRFLLTFWRLLYFDEGPLPATPTRSAEWRRGRYLAEAVAHCQECHTPRNFMGGRDESMAYSGNPHGPDGQDAPNITPDPSSGIGGWSVADITQLLTDGQTPDFDFVGSGMAEVVKGTGALIPADRHAIAVYIKSLRPIHTVRPKKKK
ncbi:MAG: c-type cytochrome [Stellaceae bacterium]